jgi:UDP-N-acetylmuramate dehydrogenase
VFPKNKRELCELISALNSINVRFKIVGKCTNMFFSDLGYDGVLIFTSALNEISIRDTDIYAECGVGLRTLVKSALEGELDVGAELYGIPGSVGGAVRMNAGAFGKSISDFILEVEAFDETTEEVLRLSREALEFGYRHSLLQCKPLYVLSAKLKSARSSREKLTESIQRFCEKRKASQPSAPSLGSFYKAFGDVSASKLIDESGLKGLAFGGASVSEKHAGFIVNNGGATASDINSLASIVEKVIMEKYSRRLVREVEFCE